MKMMQFKLIRLLAVGMMGAGSVHASEITYTLDTYFIPTGPVQPGGSSTPTSISGTVTTDGCIGNCSTSDIVSWNVSVPDYANSVTTTFTNANSFVAPGDVNGALQITDVGTTSSIVIGPNSGIAFQTTGAGTPVSTINGGAGCGVGCVEVQAELTMLGSNGTLYSAISSGPCGGTPCVGMEDMNLLTQNFEVTNGSLPASVTGSFEFATATVSPSPVPLPAAAWLMLSGLGALGATVRKREAS